MKPLAAELIRHETETILSTSLHEEAKPVTDQGHNNEFKILKLRADVYRKLEKLEAKITEKIKNLKLKEEQLDWCRLDPKQRRGLGMFRSAQYHIKYDLQELEDLREQLYEMYEDFDNQIAKLHKGIHHGSINLVKERQLFKQIKQTRREAEEMRADGPVEFWCMHVYRYVSLDTKEALKDHIEVISRKLQERRMIQMRNCAYGRLESNKVAIEKEITFLQSKLKQIKQMKVEEQRLIRITNSASGRLDSDKVAIRKEITILKSKLKNIKQLKVEASTPQLITQQIEMDVNYG